MIHPGSVEDPVEFAALQMACQRPSFGVLSAAMVVWLKSGDPVTWIIG
jgi:hypothetical protein